MKLSFEGKHVLVTGAARGIGFEIAREFGRAGARLFLLDNEAAAVEAAARTLADEGLTVTAHAGDVSSRVDVDRAVAAAEALAPLDVLVNNAGIAAETPFLALSETEWRRILDVNLTGMFLVGQAVARRMAARGRGAIVNMASKNALAGEVGYAHYNASKGGAVMLTRTMALELAAFGVRVNAVCPGYIETPLSQTIDSPEFVRDFVDRYIPLGRAGRVEDVAPVFLFLASDAAAFVTGEVVVVDGGQLAGQNPGPALRARMARAL
jgi:3-oxoacyl-[acyl-carrier protein] reductase